MTNIIDTDREILLRLNPRSLFRMLSLNHYWSTITDEYFWDRKLQQDYGIFDAIYPDLKHKQRYLALSNPKQPHEKFFKWTRTPSLESQINFQHLIKDDIFRQLISTLFIYQYEDDIYLPINYNKIYNTHCGDCIKLSCSCQLCNIEHYIRKAFKSWNKLLEWEGNDANISMLIDICNYIHPFCVEERKRIQKGYDDNTDMIILNTCKYIFMTFDEEYQEYQAFLRRNANS